MEDKLPLCHRVGFLETDSEMEISVLFLWRVFQGTILVPVRAGEKQSWAEGEVGLSRPLRWCRSWVALQSCHKLGIKSGFIIPTPPFSLPLPLG